MIKKKKSVISDEGFIRIHCIIFATFCGFVIFLILKKFKI